MDPATYTVDPFDADLLPAVLGAANCTNPTITATVAGSAVTFSADTWRPILVTRVDDALEAAQRP